jgi:putative ABC transport system ATP-binding protein
MTALPPATTPIAAHEVSLRVGDGGDRTYALSDVTIEAHAGELLAVTGPSGSGKTSLLHVLAGLEPPSDGSVVLAGVPLAALDERAATRLRREQIALLLPEAPALSTITVRENVALPLLISGHSPEPAAIDALLRRVGLGNRRNARPGTLSAGERRRAALARALLGRPSVILADEPLVDLPEDEAAELLELLRDAAHTDGIAVILFTRDPDVAAAADRSVSIVDGVVEAEIGARELVAA